jgi:hypothetical protein
MHQSIKEPAVYIRIVVLGGGFGGLYSALHFEKTIAADPRVEVTLVSRENFVLFTPMLHEVAAGDLDPSDIVCPLRPMLLRECRSINAVRLNIGLANVQQGMQNEEFNITEVMESRRHALKESLHTVSAVSLKAVIEEIFPYADHPGLETFLNVISDSASGTFYHGMVADRIHTLYAHGKEIGMWVIPGLATGPLQPDQLKIIKEIVEAMP